MKFLGIAIGAVVFTVAHPIIGPLGSLGCLLSAAYHGILLNYHWRHSAEKDTKGNLIGGTELNRESTYMQSNVHFKKKDLGRLKHERERLYHLNECIDSLKWARGLAKCTIPIFGPAWAICTKIEANGSVPLGCRGCRNHYDHETPEERINRHISKLEPNTKKDN